jgi:hypothetical protein
MRWRVTLVAEVEPGQSVVHEIASVERAIGSRRPPWD